MLNIMVVDDEAPIRDWLVYCIQKCPSVTQVTSAVNGDEAYRMILETKPNMVFTDIRMPLMDGLELMSKVREILPFTVFIILTNYAEFSYAKEAISLGAREYILKSEMRSADIQRIVGEIAANTAKIKAEKVQDTLRDGVVDLYEMYHNFEQPGAVAAFWQRQGLQNHQPYLAFCVANDNSVGLRRQIAELAGASRVALSLAAMEQDYLYLILQCHDSEALKQCVLSVEASLGECGLPAGVSAIRTDTDQFIKVLGEAAAARDACFFTGGGVVPYSAIRSLPPIDWEDVLTRKQEIIHLLSHRQPEEALEALKNWFSLFRMVGADDIRKAITASGEEDKIRIGISCARKKLDLEICHTIIILVKRSKYCVVFHVDFFYHKRTAAERMLEIFSLLYLKRIHTFKLTLRNRCKLCKC